MKSNLSKKAFVFFIVLIIFLLIVSGIENKFYHVNNFTVILLIVLILLPYFPLIKKIKYGDFEAEISPKEVDDIKEASNNIPKQNIEGELQDPLDEIWGMVNSDPQLALAKVRIEIEKRLKTIFQITQNENEKIPKRGVTYYIDKLNKKKIIEKNVLSVIEDIVSVANRAIHGEKISTDSAAELIETAYDIIFHLDFIITDSKENKVTKEIISKDELEHYRNSTYELITMIPYVTNPVKRTYLLKQDELDDMLEGYNEYAEFMISLKNVDTEDAIKSES
jgi:hypothetical protein